jgi:hypothetical protein
MLSVSQAIRALSACALGVSLGGAARAAPAAGYGRVTFLTGKHAYLDRGRSDGLARGQPVLLLRAGRPVGKCAIDALGDHLATCHGARARVGDLFRLGRAPARAAGGGAAPLPPLIDDETLRTRAATLAAAPFAKVDFAGAARAGSLPPAVMVALGVTVYSAAGAATAPYATEQVDVAVRRVPVGDSDFRFDAGLTALRWQTSGAALRFRPDAPTQLYLWEAELSRREIEDRTVLALGRVWPWHLPGIPVLDGVQVGRRNQEETVEWGAYGGLLPSPLALAPTFDSWAGGAYAAATRAGAAGDLVQLARGEARLGARHSPVVGMVSEAEVLGETAFPALAIDAGGRARRAAAVERAPVLEQAYADLRLRRASAAGAWLQLRYVGAPPEQQALLASELPALKGGYHAAFNAYWDPQRSWQIAALGASHVDLDHGTRETDVGLELGLPRCLGDFGGLWGGASAGEGWLRTRTAYLQLVGQLVPADRLTDAGAIHVLGRLTGATSQFTAPSAMPNTSEVGGSALIDATVTRRLRLRGRAQVRVPLLTQGLPAFGAGVAGLTGVAFVTGLDVVMTL